VIGSHTPSPVRSPTLRVGRWKAEGLGRAPSAAAGVPVEHMIAGENTRHALGDLTEREPIGHITDPKEG
jgi:hypothetical protein